MPICLVALTEQKIWVLNGTKLTTLNIGIGRKTSIYNKYLTCHDKLAETLQHYYSNEDMLHTLDELNEPNAQCHKTELVFSKLRRNKLFFMNFHVPTTTNTVVDFLVDNIKFQEKIGQISGNTVRFYLKRNKYCYVIGENDFYWLHFPDMIHFLLIPEQVLINMGFIGSSKKDQCKSYFSINLIHQGNKWQKYLFEYNNPDESKLKLLIGI